MKKQFMLCAMVIFANFTYAETISDQINITSQTNNCNDSSCVVKINISANKASSVSLSNADLVIADGDFIHSSCDRSNCLIVSRLDRKSQVLELSLDVDGTEHFIEYDYKLPQHL